jgi:glycerate kinase
MAAALGVQFLNGEGKTFIPTGGTLSQIKAIDANSTKELLKDCKVTAMCDIDNPMFGKTGAAYIFGPQKGADAEMVELLDENLRALSEKITKDLGIDVAQLPGAGAAGAMGAGIAAFLGGELKAGIQTVLDLVQFEDILQGADLVFTGEGKIDGQSLRGKVVIGVSQRSVKQNVPVVAVVGDVGDDAAAAYDKGVTAIFSINRLAIPFEKASLRSKQDLTSTVNDILRFHKFCR